MDHSKHVFSIYVENLSDVFADAKSGQPFAFKNKDLHKRLTRVLRLKPEEHIIFFDKHMHVTCSLQPETLEQNKQVFVLMVNIDKNKPLTPEIMLCPCLLTKGSFENVIYMAAAMGANSIQPILSEKVKRTWARDKERERLEKIIIAACEQSKHFSVPKLCDPVELQDFVKADDAETEKVLFDVDGERIFDLLHSLHNNKIKKLVLLLGPEGGLTNEERDVLEKAGFHCYTLTPTVLRSVEAVAAALGCVRSVGR